MTPFGPSRFPQAALDGPFGPAVSRKRLNLVQTTADIYDPLRSGQRLMAATARGADRREPTVSRDFGRGSCRACHQNRPESILVAPPP